MIHNRNDTLTLKTPGVTHDLTILAEYISYPDSSLHFPPVVRYPRRQDVRDAPSSLVSVIVVGSTTCGESRDKARLQLVRFAAPVAKSHLQRTVIVNSRALFRPVDGWRGSVGYWFTSVVTNLSSCCCQQYVTVFTPQSRQPPRGFDRFVCV